MSRTPPAPAPLQAPSEPPGRSPQVRRASARPATIAGLLLGATLLAGCSVPDVASMSPNLPERPQPTQSPASAAAPQSPGLPGAAPAASINTAGDTLGTVRPALSPADRGDLFRGSLTRKLAAGDRSLAIDYWTDADPATLSASTPTTVKLSAHLEDGDTEHGVKVSRFLATVDDGSTSQTLAEDRGEFVLTPPYSYGSALTIRPTDPAATAVTLSIQFDLLVETAPGSGAYFRQTVLDSVRIALPATVRGTAS